MSKVNSTGVDRPWIMDNQIFVDRFKRFRFPKISYFRKKIKKT